MPCPEFDWKAYVLEELPAADAARAGEHALHCPACAEELERLRLTHAALVAVPDEEPPRRISFVSDKVFEPRWWQRFLASGPQLGFASAAMLSIALLVNAFTRPAAAPPVPAPAGVDEARVAALVNQRLDAELSRRLPAAVNAALQQSATHSDRQVKLALADFEKKLEFERRADLVAVEENFRLLRERLTRVYVASNTVGGE
ncbi:MAG: hypothetical protein SFV54_21835 [Bryobacteraceae bacterium]|nr:hypothetical protein [Bryobacteraceae bacterium]